MQSEVRSKRSSVSFASVTAAMVTGAKVPHARTKVSIRELWFVSIPSTVGGLHYSVHAGLHASGADQTRDILLFHSMPMY